MIAKEYLLVVESDGKRFFGKFAAKDEKERWKEENKGKHAIFGKNAPPKKVLQDL